MGRDIWHEPLVERSDVDRNGLVGGGVFHVFLIRIGGMGLWLLCGQRKI